MCSLSLASKSIVGQRCHGSGSLETAAHWCTLQPLMQRERRRQMSRTQSNIRQVSLRYPLCPRVSGSTHCLHCQLPVASVVSCSPVLCTQQLVVWLGGCYGYQHTQFLPVDSVVDLSSCVGVFVSKGISECLPSLSPALYLLYYVPPWSRP